MGAAHAAWGLPLPVRDLALIEPDSTLFRLLREELGRPPRFHPAPPAAGGTSLGTSPGFKTEWHRGLILPTRQAKLSKSN